MISNVFILGSQTHAKTNDMQKDYYLNQKKALEINPRHPLIKELLRRVEDNPDDNVAKEMSVMMFNTATLRSGYRLRDTTTFAQTIEFMMRDTLGIDKDEQVEEEEEIVDDTPEDDDEDEEEEEDVSIILFLSLDTLDILYLTKISYFSGG